MMNRLDRSIPLPLYHQLKLELLRDMREHGLVAGDRLPTEAEIEARYDVSRSTIRQALSQLVAEGLVQRIQGKGTFVADRTIVHAPLLMSFTENMTAQGYVPTRRIVRMDRRLPDTEIAARLGAEDGVACTYLLRTLLADEETVGVAETWLPGDLIGDDELDVGVLETSSLYDVLQRPPISLDLYHGTETIRAQGAGAEAAALLGVNAYSPVLVVERVTRNSGDRVVESTRTVFAAERYEYVVEMDRPGETGRAETVDRHPRGPRTSAPEAAPQP